MIEEIDDENAARIEKFGRSKFSGDSDEKENQGRCRRHSRLSHFDPQSFLMGLILGAAAFALLSVYFTQVGPPEIR